MNKDETGAVSTANALKMAIEALQNNQTYDWKGNLLTALDEANEKVINACKEALEHPAQEPVAWIYQSNSGHPALRWENTTSFDYDSIAKKQPVIPLYTHPAQPLSDDEILQIYINDPAIDSRCDPQLIKFARAIEQAHGIV